MKKVKEEQRILKEGDAKEKKEKGGLRPNDVNGVKKKKK